MNATEKYMARKLFQVKALSSDGQAYQDLFTRVMRAADPGFRPIKPQGKKGDKKNDGFNKTDGRYYQCYAPEDLKGNDGKAAKKIKTDLSGLIAYWQETSPVKEYYFVVNDQYKGTYPEMEAALAEVEKQTKVKCRPFLTSHLEDAFLALHDPDILDIVGILPDALTVETVDFSVMADVIKFILKQPGPISSEAIPKNPDFDKKIVFNDLSEKPAHLLKHGSFQSHVIVEYFALNSAFTKTDLRDRFAKLYADGMAVCPAGEEKADLVFFYIYHNAAPDGSKAALDAVIVLMAYYFEYCDIFETPKRKNDTSD